MANVNDYVYRIGKRLGQAFSFEAFDTEDELEFWTLASEHLSRSEPPVYHDIVDWIDLLYQASAHFVYVAKSEDKLQLFRRMLITKNIEENLRRIRKKGSKLEETVTEFEDRFNNLKLIIRKTSAMSDFGFLSFPIGKCYHIPLHRESDFLGIYCVGPYVEHPDAIIPRLPIVSRILSIWISKDYTKEYSHHQLATEDIYSSFDRLTEGNITIEGYGKVFLQYLTSIEGIERGGIIEVGSPSRIIVQSNMSSLDTLQNALDQLELSYLSKEEIPIKIREIFLKNSPSHEDIHIEILEKTENSILLLFVASKENNIAQSFKSRGYQRVYQMFSDLAGYREQGVDLAQKLIDMYYHMIRDFEKKKQRRHYHTDRMIALVSMFAHYYEMGNQERNILIQTAKLHDIGYLSTDQSEMIEIELEHPLLGEMLVKHLSVDQEVVQGIRTHHEWIDGSGTPNGLLGEEISWTGKIIGLFEFIVEFIETHRNNNNNTNKEWIDALCTELINRADIQFDMILVPTAIEMINEAGWNIICKMGEGR